MFLGRGDQRAIDSHATFALWPSDPVYDCHNTGERASFGDCVNMCWAMIATAKAVTTRWFYLPGYFVKKSPLQSPPAALPLFKPREKEREWCVCVCVRERERERERERLGSSQSYITSERSETDNSWSAVNCIYRSPPYCITETDQWDTERVLSIQSTVYWIWERRERARDWAGWGFHVWKFAIMTIKLHFTYHMPHTLHAHSEPPQSFVVIWAPTSGRKSCLQKKKKKKKFHLWQNLRTKSFIDLYHRVLRHSMKNDCSKN